LVTSFKRINYGVKYFCRVGSLILFITIYVHLQGEEPHTFIAFLNVYVRKFHIFICIKYICRVGSLIFFHVKRSSDQKSRGALYYRTGQSIAPGFCQIRDIAYIGFRYSCCDTMWFRWSAPSRKDVSSLFSVFQPGFTLITTYKVTLNHNSEVCNRHLHRRENINSQTDNYKFEMLTEKFVSRWLKYNLILCVLYLISS
jgi:hypothetical protein